VPSSIGLVGEAVGAEDGQASTRPMVYAVCELGALQGSPNTHQDEVGTIWPGHWQCTSRHVTGFPIVDAAIMV
jgi:hypothetical protein